MTVTYSAQRASIIGRKGGIDPILQWWPYLQEEEYFCLHASYLLVEKPEENSIKKIWTENLNKKSSALWYVMSGACKMRRIEKASKELRPKLEKMQALMKEAQECSQNRNSRLPKTIAVFQLLAIYLKDDFERMVKVKQVRNVCS